MAKRKKTKMKVTTTTDLADYSFEINQRKIELFELWEDIFDVCRTIVDSAKLDPSSVKASMLSTVVRLLAQSNTVLKEAEKFRDSIKAGITKETDDLPASEVVEEEVSEADRELLKAFDKLDAGNYDLYTSEDTKADEPASIPNSNDDDLRDGFNYRRD